MATGQEIALVRARTNSEQGEKVYWIFSRAQIEFVLKELDHEASASGQTVARYQDITLPVLSLEKHYGMGEEAEKSSKYLVLRAVDKSGKLQRLIVACGASPQFLVPDSGVTDTTDFSLLANPEDVLGIYRLGGEKIGVVPDIARICAELD